MSTSCVNGSYPSQTNHLKRGEAINSCTITDLTKRIVPPCPDCAIDLQGNGMRSTSSYDDYASKSTHLNRDSSTNCCTISKLTITVITPSPDRSVIL